MIYTDLIHLISDKDLDELHAFAEQVGVNKCWFHNPRGKNKPHYDIKGEQVTKAIQAGAIVVNSKKIVLILRHNYLKEKALKDTIREETGRRQKNPNQYSFEKTQKEYKG